MNLTAYFHIVKQKQMNTYISPSFGTGTIVSQTDKTMIVDFSGTIREISKQLNKKSIKRTELDAFFNSMTPAEMTAWDARNDAKNAWIKNLAK